MKASMKWQGGMKFEGTSAFGHKIVTDTSTEHEGEASGYKPTELMLYAIAGCTGVDIVRLMKKQRQKMTSLEIEVTGHHNDDYPKPVHTFEVKYIITGENIEEKRVQRAIDFSEEKYCMVSLTMKEPAKVTSTYEIREG